VSVLASFVREVEDAVSGDDGRNRVVALRKVTDLFVQQAPSLAEQHVSVFDEVLVRLARNLEFRARIELSERLADLPNAPRGTIRDLALDDAVVVARPVLERSTRLSEGELIEVALKQSQDHLLAISRRSSLTENVTDILVERGNEKVVRSVAGNAEARFSRHGFDRLLVKAGSDVELQGLLKARQDLPDRTMAALVELAREHVRTKLQAEMGEAAGDLVEAAVARATSARDPLAQSAVLADLERAAAGIGEAAAGEIDEETIAAWIRQDRVEHALAALARLADIPLAMVAKAYHAPEYDPLLFIVRSLGFGWIVFKLFLTKKAGRQPPYDVMRSAFDSFQQLSVATAQRVVRFTVAREFGPPEPAA
jgi:uncharacterized protein (DUF2336 family)